MFVQNKPSGEVEMTGAPSRSTPAWRPPSPVMHYVRSTAIIAAKDLRSEIRSKEGINASLAFAMVVLLLLSFAFDPASEQVREFSGGLLWLVFAFAGTLILNRSFARELGNDCLDALLSSPLPASALFLGKCIANWALLCALEIACLPVFGVFYNVRWTVEWPGLLLVIALATWGLTVIGTVFSALTVNLRLRELMLPILVYPMLIPALLGAITLTTDLLADVPITVDNRIWLNLLIGFDIIYTALSAGLIETVLVG